MNYNINFNIIAAIYLFTTTLFYTRQSRVKSRRSFLFSAMLHLGVISLVLDTAVAVMDAYAHMWQPWLIYLLNIVFLLSVQISGALFFFYVLNITGNYRRVRKSFRIAALFPLATAAALLLLSPFSQNFIFYLDAANVYHRGALHLVLYGSVASYLLTSLAVVLVCKKRLSTMKFATTLAFLAAVIAAMFVQLNLPHILVNSAANAFALMLIYHILEAPGAHMDALTGAYNRTALLPIIGDIYDEGERFSLLVYSIESLHIVNHSFGMKSGDEVLTAFADYLKHTWPKGSIFRLEGDVFGALLKRGAYTDKAALEVLGKATKSAFLVSAGEINLKTSLVCINSEDCETPQEAAELLENLMSRHRAGTLKGALVADSEFKARIQKTEAVEKATLTALNENRVEVYYQPIHDSNGRLCALEALVRVIDPCMGLLPTQELVELAEKNGSIMRLGEQVLEKTCAFVRDNDLVSWGLDHVGVNLSAVQCVQEGLPATITRILKEYDIPDSLVAFEVTETAAGVLAAEQDNMQMLAAAGIHFLLDDFGTGYANFRNMTALPYHCIKLDKSLLWNAHKSKSRMQLLEGVVNIIQTLGLTSLCEGVETKEHVELLKSMGVSMMQGYYYSKPLPPEKLLDYAKNTFAGGA